MTGSTIWLDGGSSTSRPPRPSAKWRRRGGGGPRRCPSSARPRPCRVGTPASRGSVNEAVVASKRRDQRRVQPYRALRGYGSQDGKTSKKWLGNGRQVRVIARLVAFGHLNNGAQSSRRGRSLRQVSHPGSRRRSSRPVDVDGKPATTDHRRRQEVGLAVRNVALARWSARTPARTRACDPSQGGGKS